MQMEIVNASKENNKIIDLRLLYEEKLDKKEGEIYSLKDENIRLKDAVKGKDDAIQALSYTLIEKGEHNKRLMEKIAEMKNHQLQNHFLNQSFLVS